MADYITRIRTAEGDKQIDYNELANLPDLSNFSTDAEPPADTKLFWIDPAEENGGLKYYNGTEWVLAVAAINGEEIDAMGFATTEGVNEKLEDYALKTDLDDKADSDHTHTVDKITDLQDALNGKANDGHKHKVEDITEGVLPVSMGGTGVDSVTADHFVVGNGTSNLVEKTPEQVLTIIKNAEDQIEEFEVDENSDGSVTILEKMSNNSTNTYLISVDENKNPSMITINGEVEIPVKWRVAQ